MDTFPTSPDNQKAFKGFWDRKEGVTGMVTLGLMGLGGFFLLKAFLPTLIEFFNLGITALGKGIIFTGLGAVLFVLLYTVFNPKVHRLFSYYFKTLMRKVTQLFVEIDPVGILRVYISELTKKREYMDEKRATLNGQIRIIKEKQAKAEAGYEKALSTAKIAKEKGMSAQFTLQARQAGRLQSSSMTYADLLKRCEFLYRVLTKYYEATGIVIEDMKNEVDNEVDRRNTMKSAWGAMMAAKQILQGAGEDKEMYDMALEHLVNDYGQKMGEIEDFISTSSSFMEGLDLQNGVYEADALKAIEDWEAKVDSKLLGTDKRLMVETMAVKMPTAVAVESEDFNKFFK